MLLEYTVKQNKNQMMIEIHSTAGSSNNLNPQNVIKAIKESGIEVEDYEIKRKELIIG